LTDVKIWQVAACKYLFDNRLALAQFRLSPLPAIAARLAVLSADRKQPIAYAGVVFANATS
jgi:hypothetical protein